MSVIILFMAGIAAIAGWWLSQQRLTAKPWLEEGLSVDLREGSTSFLPPAKIGLGVFLAVVGSLFALFISAYSTRAATTSTASSPDCAQAEHLPLYFCLGSSWRGAS